MTARTPPAVAAPDLALRFGLEIAGAGGPGVGRPPLSRVAAELGVRSPSLYAHVDVVTGVITPPPLQQSHHHAT